MRLLRCQVLRGFGLQNIVWLSWKENKWKESVDVVFKTVKYRTDSVQFQVMLQCCVYNELIYCFGQISAIWSKTMNLNKTSTVIETAELLSLISLFYSYTKNPKASFSEWINTLILNNKAIYCAWTTFRFCHISTNVVMFFLL